MTKSLFKSAYTQNTFLTLLGIVMAIFIAEGAARLLPPPIEGLENAAEMCNTPTGWRGRANFISTIDTAGYVHDLQLNSRGMHDQEHVFDKPDDTYRILMLGDSFVQAIQVKESETAHQVLEELLNTNADQTFEVISGGVSGWGTGQQLQYYRSEGHRYEPDLVLLMVYLGNDIKDNLPGRGITVNGYNCYTPYFVLEAGQLDPGPWLFAPGFAPSTGNLNGVQKLTHNLLGWLYRHSRLYGQLEPLVSVPPIEASALDFYIGQNETFDYALDLTAALAKQLEVEVRLDGAKFAAVVISPLALIEFEQLTAEEREQIYQNLPAMRRAEEIPPPNETVEAMLLNKDIVVLDLFPALVAQANKSGDNLYFKADKHWNREGNRVAAEAMAEWLQNSGLLE